MDLHKRASGGGSKARETLTSFLQSCESTTDLAQKIQRLTASNSGSFNLPSWSNEGAETAYWWTQKVCRLLFIFFFFITWEAYLLQSSQIVIMGLVPLIITHTNLCFLLIAFVILLSFLYGDFLLVISPSVIPKYSILATLLSWSSSFCGGMKL